MTDEIVCYDPRDPTQIENDSATWKSTRNPALIAAHLSSPCAHQQPTFWEGVKALANLCDEPVPLGRAYLRHRLGVMSGFSAESTFVDDLVALESTMHVRDPDDAPLDTLKGDSEIIWGKKS